MNNRVVKLLLRESIERSHRRHKHFKPFILHKSFERHSNLRLKAVSKLEKRIRNEIIPIKLLVEVLFPKLELQVVLDKGDPIFELDWGKAELIHKLLDSLLGSLPKFAYLFQQHEFQLCSGLA